MNDFNDFLTEQGLAIFDRLKTHVSQLGIKDADNLELAMLANSFDVYSQNATYCKANGSTFEMATKTGTYPMIRPEYNVMKNEYSNILKHSAKFGLNPADREKLFKSVKPKKKNPVEGLD